MLKRSERLESRKMIITIVIRLALVKGVILTDQKLTSTQNIKKSFK